MICPDTRSLVYFLSEFRKEAEKYQESSSEDNLTKIPVDIVHNPTGDKQDEVFVQAKRPSLKRTRKGDSELGVKEGSVFNTSNA